MPMLKEKINKDIEFFKSADGKTGVEWITRDKNVIEKYASNPYCNFRFTIWGFKDLITVQDHVNKKKNMARIPKGLPVLIVSGAEDPVGDYGRGVKKVRDMMTDAGINDVTMKLYEGCRHEVHNELEPYKHEFYNDVINWINERIKNN